MAGVPQEWPLRGADAPEPGLASWVNAMLRTLHRFEV
jgi:hypothetical protein